MDDPGVFQQVLPSEGGFADAVWSSNDDAFGHGQARAKNYRENLRL
jgi:hypothetical protein